MRLVGSPHYGISEWELMQKLSLCRTWFTAAIGREDLCHERIRKVEREFRRFEGRKTSHPRNKFRDTKELDYPCSL